jgi:hypothetical protein
VSHALVSVSASDEEHGSTVGDSTNNGTASDDGAGLVDSAAGANVTSHGTTVTRSACRASTWLGSCIGRAVVTRKLAGVLISIVRSFTVEFLLCQKASAGLRSCAASLVCKSSGIVNKAKVVMKPWYSMVFRGLRPKFLTSVCEMFKPSAMARGK